MDPFEILGVAPDATLDEVRSAYRHLVRELHPDTRSPDLDAATADEALRRVQWAYGVLTSPEAGAVAADGSVTWSDAAGARFQVTDRDAHAGVRRFPWWIVAIAVLMAIFIITAYAGSVPVSSP